MKLMSLLSLLLLKDDFVFCVQQEIQMTEIILAY